MTDRTEPLLVRRLLQARVSSLRRWHGVKLADGSRVNPYEDFKRSRSGDRRERFGNLLIGDVFAAALLDGQCKIGPSQIAAGQRVSILWGMGGN